ncbi:MAG: 50S ribosomal protein L32 [Mariprofundaceae bacterium]|nr:50S ribosomal protein L32 [Mariprofundaceae bacterium]
MAVPKRKTSTSKRNMRRAHDHVSATAMIGCPHCGEMMRPHHVCPHCGHYKGREIIATDEA